MFIGLGKHPVTNIHKDSSKINISKASVIEKDILLFATGETVQICLDAAEELEKYKVIAKVVSIPTILPLDDTSV
ncbi:transketolase C-terminal domain-containing protein [Bartonella sp. B39]